MIYSQKEGSPVAVKPLKDKAINRSTRTNDKVRMQRKDNNKRNLEDVENAETNNRRIEVHMKLHLLWRNSPKTIRQHWRHWVALMHANEIGHS